MSRALIVDDKVENIYFLQILLQAHGYEVACAENGAVALDQAKLAVPDLIISDILMPVMDGFTFCIQCKSDSSLDRVPFIFFTATYTDPKDEQFALSLGADLFLVKPVEPTELMEKINQVLASHQEKKLQEDQEKKIFEQTYLKEYNEILIHKLEDKMAQLDASYKVLEESEARYRNLFDRVPIGLFRINAEGEILDINPALLSLLGYPSQEVLSQASDARHQISLLDHNLWQPAMNAMGIVQGFEVAWLRPNGEFIWVEETVRKIVDDKGRVLYEGSVQDITARKKATLQLFEAYDTTLEGWTRALDLRDQETEGHSERVTTMTIALAQKIGINGEELDHIRRGALLHDIGKIGIPDSILHKKGELTQEEWLIMRRHPTYAFELLSPIDYLRPALEIPYCHHEKWDGTGYPRRLRGEQIPLAARLFAPADVWDALCSNRPYRLAWKLDLVLEYFNEQKGKHFDPDIVPAFLELIGFGG